MKSNSFTFLILLTASLFVGSSVHAEGSDPCNEENVKNMLLGTSSTDAELSSKILSDEPATKSELRNQSKSDARFYSKKQAEDCFQKVMNSGGIGSVSVEKNANTGRVKFTVDGKDRFFQLSSKGKIFSSALLGKYKWNDALSRGGMRDDRTRFFTKSCALTKQDCKAKGMSFDAPTCECVPGPEKFCDGKYTLEQLKKQEDKCSKDGKVWEDCSCVGLCGAQKLSKNKLGRLEATCS